MEEREQEIVEVEVVAVVPPDEDTNTIPNPAMAPEGRGTDRDPGMPHTGTGAHGEQNPVVAHEGAARNPVMPHEDLAEPRNPVMSHEDLAEPRNPVMPPERPRRPENPVMPRESDM